MPVTRLRGAGGARVRHYGAAPNASLARAGGSGTGAQEEERLPCVFKTSALYLGHLDAGAAARDVEGGTSLDLPLWLVRPLAGRDIVAPGLPPAFSGKTRSALHADANCVRLRDQSAFFYELGLAAATLCRGGAPEAASLPEALRRALSARYEAILDKASNSRGRDVNAFTRHLSNLEAAHFGANYAFATHRHEWRTRAIDKLGASKMMPAPGASRKRAAGAVTP